MGKSKKVKSEHSKELRKYNPARMKEDKRENHLARQEQHLEHIPFRLREIMKSKERIAMGASKLKKMRKATAPKPVEGAAEATDIPVPCFRRGQRESERAYLHRMEQETQHVLFLTKNQVQRQPEVELQEQEQPAGRRKAEKKKEFDKIKVQKIEKKKMAKREKIEEKEKFTDRVSFGEVVMAPPSLTAKPKRAPTKSGGITKGLLLNSLLGHTSLSTSKPSMARQKMMEEERIRVVEAYRNLKKVKQEWQGSNVTGKDELQKPH
uniref:Coiled-coil domain containing 137 n=1 Tax=Scleropages formosus TaxID=113540 RepID=A0A8C9TN32_SCLFO